MAPLPLRIDETFAGCLEMTCILPLRVYPDFVLQAKLLLFSTQCVEIRRELTFES
jgi:hypothetical protein